MQLNVEERQIAGVRQILRTGGNASALEAAVFVHGNPGSSEDWIGMMQAVSPFVRTVAPDMPGYGQSDRPDDFDYTVPGFAKQLGKVIDAMGVERVHLVLHDFGGPWGLQWASAHPARVASLTLVNMGVVEGYRWHFAARIWRTPGLGELFQAVSVWPLFKFVVNRQNPKPLPEEFLRRMHRDSDAGNQRATRRLYRATDNFDAVMATVKERLAPRRLPALVLWGEDDAYVPVAYADPQSEFFDATIHRLPGCGHWPMIDDPSRVEGLFADFLQKHVGTPRR